MNPLIFREYDIRGVVENELTPEVVERIAKAIGTYVRRRYTGEVVVGRDVRLSSPRLASEILAGLRAVGLDCVDIGTVPTPLLYYAVTRGGEDSYAAGVMITGSHNPPEFNGIKICHGTTPIFGPAIQEIRKLAEAEDFESGEGALRTDDVVPDYIDEVAAGLRLARPVRVAVDCGNGTAGPVAIPLLRKIGCDVIPLFEEPDGRFPNHHPDPTVPKYIRALIEEVKKSGCELGVGYDGDSDRIGAVDEKGDILFGDTLAGVFARSVLAKKPGTIVFDVKCSVGLVEAIRDAGGTPLMWKTGHSHLKQKMKDERAPFAGEMSGHVFFADRYYGYDDAIYASARLIEIVAAGGRPLSAIAAEIPRYHSTPEIRIDCPDSRKFTVVEAIQKKFRATHDVVDIDGARVNFDEGWGLVRASNTQPVLVLRFEAKTTDALAEIRDTLVGAIREQGVEVPEEALE
ncbi:MAG: phosphomannomutase/phosphoglucomutase [Candidatus Eisenbacteria bacterium]|nr:phosphomannomutase/phosphoglucomutase [Candidatus Eisenbacteria bacterium]